MHTTEEQETEIHPNALMPGRPFTTNLNMLGNTAGGSRRLTRIINFGVL